jgi:hypothetical protein
MDAGGPEPPVWTTGSSRWTPGNSSRRGPADDIVDDLEERNTRRSLGLTLEHWQRVSDLGETKGART